MSYQTQTSPSTTSFTVTFPILSLTDIKAIGKNTGAADWSELVVTNPTSISGVTTCTVTEAPNYDSVRIYRSTGNTALVDFQNGSRLSERDLDTAYNHSLFAAQEVTENAGENIMAKGDAGADGADGTDGADGADGTDGVDGTDGADATGGTNSCAFSVYMNSTGQSLANSSTTKINFTNVLYDVDSCWNTSTLKFVAPSNGYYTFKSSLGFQGTSITRVILFFYKEGNEYQRGTDLNVSGASIIHGSCDMYLSSGETCEVYGYVTGSSTSVKNQAETWFSGFKLA